MAAAGADGGAFAMTETSEILYTRVERVANVRTRPEADHTHLIYHPGTDELHLVSDAGKAIFDLCDGRSIDDVVSEGALLLGGEAGRAEREVLSFLQMLHKRAVVRFT
jgi:hypothetical protein